MTKIEQIQYAIDQRRPMLYPIRDVRGMSGDRIRMILSSLTDISKHYLECGLYCGLSLTSACYNNHSLKSVTGIDSWAEFTNRGKINPRNEFLNACQKYFPEHLQLNLIERNCWDVKELPHKPDLYYYDGDHSELSQEKALTHFGPMCADEFIYCCDDWNRPEVQRGTHKGLEMFDVLYEWSYIPPQLNDSDWWCGFYVALLKQKK